MAQQARPLRNLTHTVQRGVRRSGRQPARRQRAAQLKSFARVKRRAQPAESQPAEAAQSTSWETVRMTDSSARSTYRRPVRRVPPGTWNTERVITALVDWTSEFGRPPRTFEWGPPESAADAIGRVRARRWAAEYPRWP